jgi:glycosyl-4,4'-diaponeurosporenoate acyltransferase
MNAAVVVLLDVVIWVAICAVVGWLAGRLPRRWLETDTFVTRVRSFERGGSVYERLGVRRWKLRLPESNSLGRTTRASKRTLAGRSAVPDYLVETRRAEYVHWALLCAAPVFLLWGPAWVGRTMTVFGIAFNLPFIVVQRFNRARANRSASAPIGIGGTR